MIAHRHSHTCIHTNQLQVLNSYDPTQTTGIRNRFEAAMNRRFIALRGLVRKAIVEQDCFGLRSGGASGVQANVGLPGHRAFAFERSADKVEAFIAWLRQAASDNLLEVVVMPGRRVGSGVEASWMNTYLTSAYQKGIADSRRDMLKEGYAIPDVEGGISAVFNQPVHADRAGLIFTRAYNDLRNVTDHMASQMSQVLAQGIVDGKGPDDIARLLNKTISGTGGTLELTDTLGRFIPAQRRARMIARTEVIRAHHVANVTEMRNFGVEGVDVQAEFRTAGDSNVCEICESLQGTRYSLDEIEGMIPVHPNCRCKAYPISRRESERLARTGGPVEQPANADTIDPVAASYSNREHRELYTQARREYDEYFSSLSAEDLQTLRNATSNDFNFTDIGEAIQMKLSNEIAPNMYSYSYGDAVLPTWQGSTQVASPMRWKIAASEIEKSAGYVFARSTGQLNNVIADWMSDEARRRIYITEHIKVRAFNQAYMKMKGVKKVTLYRGMEGTTAASIRMNAARAHQNQMYRTKFTIEDSSLTGYSDAFDVADDFGGQLVWRREIAARDIVIHKDLMGGVTRSHVDEYEYIVKGGKHTVHLQDIYVNNQWLGQGN